MEANMAHVVHHHSYVEHTHVTTALWIAGALLALIAFAAFVGAYGGSPAIIADPAITMPPMFPMVPLL